MSDKNQEISHARLRWKFLASCIREHSLKDKDELSGISVRHFNGFGLFKKETLTSDESGDWSRWHPLSDNDTNLASNNTINSIVVRTMRQVISSKELIGFNNTGNVCIWPSEEILAYYCLKHNQLFRGKNICELGGGMTALAGVFLACNAEAAMIHLTDGNLMSVNNIRTIVKRNESRFRTPKVKVSELIWCENAALEGMESMFDIIICSDCLFFEDSHTGLLYVLKKILKEEGLVLMFAPKRGGSANNFIQLASSDFDVTVTENYDPLIWDRHLKNIDTPQYDVDRHFSMLITMRTKGNDT